MSATRCCKHCTIQQWMKDCILSDMTNNNKDPKTHLKTICEEIFNQPRFETNFEYAANCSQYQCKKNNSNIVCETHTCLCNRHLYDEFNTVIPYISGKENALAMVMKITEMFHNPYLCKMFCKSDNFRILFDKLSELFTHCMFDKLWDSGESGDWNFWWWLAKAVSEIMDNIWIITKYKKVVRYINNESTLIFDIGNFIIKRFKNFQMNGKLNHLPYFFYVIKALLIFWSFMVNKFRYRKHCKLMNDFQGNLNRLSFLLWRAQGNGLQKEFCLYISILRSMNNTDKHSKCLFNQQYFNIKAKSIYLKGKMKISCNYCKKSNKKNNHKICKGCKSTVYCGKTCQKMDWKDHKTYCKTLSESCLVL
eukprot:108725_1